MPDFQPIATVKKNMKVWFYGRYGGEDVGAVAFWDAVEIDWFAMEGDAFGLIQSGWVITHWAEFVSPASWSAD